MPVVRTYWRLRGWEAALLIQLCGGCGEQAQDVAGMHPCSKRGQESPWQHWEEICYQVGGVWGGVLALFSAGEALCGILCPIEVFLLEEGHGCSGKKPKARPARCCRDWNILAMRRSLERWEGFVSGRRQGCAGQMSSMCLYP